MDLFAHFPPQRWFEESQGFLDASLELLTRLAAGDLAPTWPRAKAAAFLLGHGIELFLKGAVAQASGRFPWGHDLEGLMARFRAHFPKDEVQFTSDIEGFIGANRPLPFYDFMKYPERISEINKTWSAAMYVDVEEWRRSVAMIRDDFRGVWQVILTMHPVDPARWSVNVDGEFERPRRKSSFKR